MKRTASRIFAILFAGLAGSEAYAHPLSSHAFFDPHETGAYAIDAKGVRHNRAGDCIKAVAPVYPFFGDRRHTGKGLFRLELNLNSGTVAKASVVRSTGSWELDNSAIAALRQWRWKSNRWREVVIPVKFQLTHSPQLPKGARPIPHA